MNKGIGAIMDVNALSQKGFCGFVKMRFYVKSSCFRGGELSVNFINANLYMVV